MKTKKLNMKVARIAVIVLWVISLVCSWTIVEFYVQGTVKLPGYTVPIYRVPPHERDAVRETALNPVVTVYLSYLGGMLLFVFGSRWTKKASESDDLFRYILALICTLLFNGMFLYILSRPLAGSVNNLLIQNSASRACTQAHNWSFLVAPIMAFYFGKKPSL
jgi:hypothetical protein